MLLIVRKKADEKVLKKVAEDLKGYVKVTVDIKRGIMAAGGELHVDGEKMLLEDGSRQTDIWGGGIDFETGEIDSDGIPLVLGKPCINMTSIDIAHPPVACVRLVIQVPDDRQLGFVSKEDG